MDINISLAQELAEIAVLQYAAQEAKMNPDDLDEATKRQMIDQTIGFTAAQGFITTDESGVSAHVTMKDGVVTVGTTPVFDAATMLPAMLGAATQQPAPAEN